MANVKASITSNAKRDMLSFLRDLPVKRKGINETQHETWQFQERQTITISHHNHDVSGQSSSPMNQHVQATKENGSKTIDVTTCNTA